MQLRQALPRGRSASDSRKGPAGFDDGLAVWYAITCRAEKDLPRVVGVTWYTNGLSMTAALVKTP
jgi:hypothetical protein